MRPHPMADAPSARKLAGEQCAGAGASADAGAPSTGARTSDALMLQER
jgi:hypothetical protein